MKIFIKYRTNHAWGSTNWEYGVTEDVRGFAERLHSEYDYSEKYRGCDIKTVKPSANWLKRLIKTKKSRIKEIESEIKLYSRLLKTAKNEPRMDCEKCIHYYKIGNSITIGRCKEGNSAFSKKELIKTKRTCPDMKIKIKEKIK